MDMERNATLVVKVSQAELQRISDLRREIAWMKKQLRPLEEEVKTLLLAGAEVEFPGRFTVRLDTARGCQTPRLAVAEHGCYFDAEGNMMSNSERLAWEERKNASREEEEDDDGNSNS